MDHNQQNRHVLKSRPFFDQTFTSVEAALGVLTVASALRASWIDIEDHAPSPDKAKILLWNEEREKFTSMTHKVYGQDQDTLDYVLNVLSDENETQLRKLEEQLPPGKILQIASDN
jgi:hypothetical protein